MARQVKIVGLVRVADVVRRELTAPLTPEKRDRLSAQVQENLQRVRRILADSRATLRHLPAPSQRAYQFLAGVDWSKVHTANLPPRSMPDSVAHTPRTMISWKGLGGLIERTLDRLSRAISNPELDAMGQSLLLSSRQIELTIQRQGIAPDRLSATTRVHRGWLSFFSRRENLTAYVQARLTAGRLLDAAALGSKHYPPPLAIQFRPVTGIYKLRSTRAVPLLCLPTPMIAFDEASFTTLAELVFDRGRHARQRVIADMTADGYQAVRAELELLGGIVEATRGAFHDLLPSFERVNATYFSDKMPRPRLTWNRAFTGRKFGHYNFVQDSVMVSRTLDSPDVPEFVVDFLMFHELLHKFHGLHWVNGRGYAHTSEFMDDERKFARYEEAEAELKKLATSAG